MLQISSKSGFGRVLGSIWEGLGTFWGAFWALLGASWPLFGLSKSNFFPVWVQDALQEGFWIYLEPILAGFGRDLEGF